MIPTPQLNMKVSRKAAELVGSEIIKIAGEINELKRQGAEVFNLTIGDFNPEIFPIPDALKDGIIEAYRNDQTNYPGAAGLLELRESIARLIHNRRGLEYAANDILIAGGARPLIYATYQAIVDPGDKVIFPVPSWNNNHYTHLSDGQKVFVQARPEDNFMPTAATLAPHVQDATLIALCSPLNPTGTTFPKQQLEAICDLVIGENARRGPDAKPLYLMYDQIYWMLTHGDTVHHDPVSLRPEMKSYTIFIDGLSKAFAATGVRVGWGFGPSAVIGKMKSILGHVGAWSPRAEQVATAAFLRDDEAVETYLKQIRGALHARLEGFYQGFQGLKAKGFAVDAIPPQAAIYLTVKLDLAGMETAEGKVLQGTRDVLSYVLDEAGLAIVPFYAFGASETATWYRLSVGTAKMEDIATVFKRLEAALSKLS